MSFLSLSSSTVSPYQLLHRFLPPPGYWLNYAVHLGYASFVEEVLKDVHTYPVTQWLVDVVRCNVLMQAMLSIQLSQFELVGVCVFFRQLFSLACATNPLTTCSCDVFCFLSRPFVFWNLLVGGPSPLYPTNLSAGPFQAGYIGLFTGASLFSIMVVPLLQLLRRRDRRESLAVRPLDTLYSPYHHVRASRVTPGVMGDLAAAMGAGGEGGDRGMRGSGAGPATPGGLP